MTNLTFALVLLGAVFVGALCSLIVQLVFSARRMTSVVLEAASRINTIATTLTPTAQRIDRMSALVAASEADLRTLQRSLHKVAAGSSELSDSIGRVSGWVSVALPTVIAAVDHLTHPSPPRAPEQDARAEPQTPEQGARTEPRTPENGAARDHVY